MGFIIPKEELTVAEVVEIEKTLTETLLEITAKQTGIAKEALTVREVMPKTDLGLTNEEWKISFTAAYKKEEKVRVTLPKNKFIGFYGYTNQSADPKTLCVYFATPAKTVDIWQVEKVYTYPNVTGVTREPILFAGGKTMVIRMYGKATADDYPVLKGMVCEPIGELVSPGLGVKG